MSQQDGIEVTRTGRRDDVADAAAGSTNGRDDPGSLERRSEALRADVGQTLDALQRNYSPGANLARSIKRDPMAALLTLVGIGWMMISQARHANDAKEAAAASVSGGAHRVADGSRRVAAGARERTRQAREGLQTMFEEQPFVVGAVGLALGAVIGAALPESELENRALGGMRERTLGQTGSADRPS